MGVAPTVAAIQAAVNSATNGDTIEVNAGTETWSNGIDVSGKTLSIIGAGASLTVITRSNAIAFYLGSNATRISGFGFVNAYVEPHGDGWRIDHCDFDIANWDSIVGAIYGYGESTHAPIGLIDNCTFMNGRILIYGTSYGDPDIHKLWIDELGLGTFNAVYVEDCYFDLDQTNTLNCIDTNVGGRYVFRYNETNGNYLELHGLQSGRGSRSWEVYNNTLNGRVSYTGWRHPIRMRGGSGVCFNNILTGDWTDDVIHVDNPRSCEDAWGNGYCNGSGSTGYDGNYTGEEGYPCRDQIGRGKDNTEWAPGQIWNQSKAPCYEWDNIYNPGGSDVTWYISGICERLASYHIKVNRDVYSPTVGTSLPGSASDYDGYFLTTNNTLYQWLGGQWNVYYTPYTYPHPLQGSVIPESPVGRLVMILS